MYSDRRNSRHNDQIIPRKPKEVSPIATLPFGIQGVQYSEEVIPNVPVSEGTDNSAFTLPDSTDVYWIKVAAADAPDEWKLNADFVCDGFDDQEEINNAGTLAASTFPDVATSDTPEDPEGQMGGVLLSPGTFKISDQIYFDQNVMHFKGSGDYTVIIPDFAADGSNYGSTYLVGHNSSYLDPLSDDLLGGNSPGNQGDYNSEFVMSDMTLNGRMHEQENLALEEAWAINIAVTGASGEEITAAYYDDGMDRILIGLDSGRVVAYTLEGAFVWENTDDSSEVRALHYGGVDAYVGRADGSIDRLDYATGARDWTHTLSASPVVTLANYPSAYIGSIHADGTIIEALASDGSPYSSNSFSGPVNKGYSDNAMYVALVGGSRVGFYNAYSNAKSEYTVDGTILSYYRPSRFANASGAFMVGNGSAPYSRALSDNWLPLDSTVYTSESNLAYHDLDGVLGLNDGRLIGTVGHRDSHAYGNIEYDTGDSKIVYCKNIGQRSIRSWLTVTDKRLVLVEQAGKVNYPNVAIGAENLKCQDVNFFNFPYAVISDDYQRHLFQNCFFRGNMMALYGAGQELYVDTCWFFNNGSCIDALYEENIVVTNCYVDTWWFADSSWNEIPLNHIPDDRAVMHLRYGSGCSISNNRIVGRIDAPIFSNVYTNKAAGAAIVVYGSYDNIVIANNHIQSGPISILLFDEFDYHLPGEGTSGPHNIGSTTILNANAIYGSVYMLNTSAIITNNIWTPDNDYGNWYPSQLNDSEQDYIVKMVNAFNVTMTGNIIYLGLDSPTDWEGAVVVDENGHAAGEIKDGHITISGNHFDYTDWGGGDTPPLPGSAIYVKDVDNVTVSVYGNTGNDDSWAEGLVRIENSTTKPVPFNTDLSLFSPDGTEFRVYIKNDGTLTAEEL
ncbi:MAG: hypothetical protein ACQ5SW_03355 [Sphaerochaetaceae bacterium]